MEVNKILSEIPSSEGWKVIEEIKYGWSEDRKFYVETEDGKKLLARLIPISYQEIYNDTKIQYEFIKECNKLDVKACKAIDFGKVNNKPYLYMILSYVEGEPLENMLRNLSNEEQYDCGSQAGRSLRKIHDLDYGEQFDGKAKLQRYFDRKKMQLENYTKSELRLEDDEGIIEFVSKTLPDVICRPTTFLHGDYHLGNLIYTPNGEVGVIDFNASELGDRYEDFYRLEILFGSKFFIRGLIDAYFEIEKEIPDEFWKMFKFYNLHAALCAILWANNYSSEEAEKMSKRSIRTLEHYEYGKLLIPSWYERKE
ncbi:hypothetical protein BG262_00320 [Floricoccus penangensis]|uniref:Aminoglycoside phosphotransferase domain-containing protein n=1 Tax=Floricoccus penangensis TaxID=1859475 RepID=A0A9Q5P1I1_9LACT|nr:phosphotransferase [Floricoccus penangensis]OFI47986.1 hypothetical protein BG262_00320 [Floricoccus penangensis]